MGDGYADLPAVRCMCIVRNLGLDVVNAKGGKRSFAAVDTKFGSAGCARPTKASVCQGGSAWIHIGRGSHIIKAPTYLCAEDVGAAVA